jgi:hypothetical protein
MASGLNSRSIAEARRDAVFEEIAQGVTRIAKALEDLVDIAEKFRAANGITGAALREERKWTP